ncbi:MAG: hypothetical protein IPG44_18080 [Anaerolineales bacterium]|jgi:hypothetical protein|nr:hypothetical protein [Chloroflexota bacterium]MBK6647620.1 hypothetical protein [Anaerolineales bacterium]MCC6984809.1 hypothetical protein [Anaerolineales bacterium]
MTNETTAVGQKRPVKRGTYRGGASEAVYAFGLFGAWYYYLTTASSIWMGLLGILKGFIWPATLVYEILKYLEM